MIKRFLYRKSNLLFFLFLIISFSLPANSKSVNSPKQNDSSSVTHTAWSRNLPIYEVNVRQYTPEGTFKAFATSLPKLKEMGIGILWFMPINPIGELHRKGSLGSYYSVKDYTAVNPEFGTIEDFKFVVKQAHDLGMYVIIDWVANHSAWDNVWTKTHPDFYKKDNNGNFISPYNWTDVIALNYDNKELWNYMRDAMKFWIENCDIDGFRCDVAAMVPLEFWKWVRPQLDKLKPTFMLAEASEPEMHQVFDMTYNWQLKDLFVGCAHGNKTADDFYKYFDAERKDYPTDGYRMVFTSNHDENSWNGTDIERFGNAAEMFSILTCVVPGMPLVYNGEEAGLDKRLKFFDKDFIEWEKNKMYSIYQKLFQLKKENKAIWNGVLGGEFQKINSGNNDVFSFFREKDGNKVLAFFNLSKEKKQITVSDSKIAGTYKNLFSDNNVPLSSQEQFTLAPWGYLVLYK